MSTYYVRDTFGYVTVVEATGYQTSRDGTFEFFNEDEITVASFLMGGVISVVEADETFQQIFLNDESEIDDTDEPETDDVCLDCRFEETLGSEAFFDAVTDVIDAYCCPDENEDSAPIPFDPPQLKVVKGVVKSSGRVEYGFLTPKGFVNVFEGISTARQALNDYLNSDRSGWRYENPENYTFSEVENG